MHSSLSDRLPSVNASLMLARVLARMQDELRLTFHAHPLCPAPTLNLGVKLKGGVSYGVFPGLAEFQSDVRTLPGMTQQQLRADVERFLDILRSETADLDVELEFEQAPLNWIAPTEVGAYHPFVEALLRAADDVLGWRPTLSSFPGATDARNFQGVARIPTIPSFGPGWLPLAHGPNECVGMDAILQAAKMYALAAKEYLSVDGRHCSR